MDKTAILNKRLLDFFKSEYGESRKEEFEDSINSAFRNIFKDKKIDPEQYQAILTEYAINVVRILEDKNLVKASEVNRDLALAKKQFMEDARSL